MDPCRKCDSSDCICHAKGQSTPLEDERGYGYVDRQNPDGSVDREYTGPRPPRVRIRWPDGFSTRETDEVLPARCPCGVFHR